MFGLERLARRFTPSPEKAPEDQKPAAVSSEDQVGKKAITGAIEDGQKIPYEKPRPRLKLLPPEPEAQTDDAADWIQKLATQPETKQGKARAGAEAEARARSEQLDRSQKKDEQVALARKEVFAEHDRSYKTIREHQKATPEQALDSLVGKMRELNARRAGLEAEVESADALVGEATVALGRAGILKDTVGAMKRAMRERVETKRQVVEIDKEIQAMETQMDEIIGHMQVEREQESQRYIVQTSDILKGTGIDPRDQSAIEKWFVDPNEEFDSDIYEQEKSAVSPEVLTALKSNSLLEIDKEKVLENVEKNRETLKQLELKRDQLEDEGEEKFGAVLGFDIEDLQIKKSAWGRLLFKARLGKLRTEFTKWEHDYNELSDKIKRASEDVIQDELYLKDPHKAAANEVRNITSKLGRSIRSSAPVRGTRGLSS